MESSLPDENPNAMAAPAVECVTRAHVVPSLATLPSTYLLAWVYRRRWVLFAALFVLYLAAFSGRWRPGPDTSLYVSLGRNLAKGEAYHAVGWPRGNTHFGMAMLLAGNFRLFGPTTFWPMLVLVWTMGAVALLFVYRLLRFWGTREEAVLITLLVGTSFTFTEFLYELLTDMPCFLGIVASMVAFEELGRERVNRLGMRRVFPLLLWSLVLCGGLALAVVMRPVTWALMGAMALTLAGRARSREGWRRMIVTAVLIAGALAFFYWMDPRPKHMVESHEAWVYRVLFEQTTATLRNITTHTFGLIFGRLTVQTLFTFSLGPVLSSVLAVTVLGAMLWACRRRLLWFLWSGLTLVMLLIYPEPQTRYYLAILPFLAIGYWRVAMWIAGWQRRRLAACAFGVWLALWVIPNIVRFGRLAALQHSEPFLLHVTNGRFAPMRTMDQVIDEKLPADAVIMSEEALALEAFAPERRFVMPMGTSAPPELKPEMLALVKSGRLYVVETGSADCDQVLERLNFSTGPSLATVPRWAWELPRAPQRWIWKEDVRVPPPLILRQVVSSAPR